jgi:hypothetical protein
MPPSQALVHGDQLEYTREVLERIGWAIGTLPGRALVGVGEVLNGGGDPGDGGGK